MAGRGEDGEARRKGGAGAAAEEEAAAANLRLWPECQVPSCLVGNVRCCLVCLCSLALGTSTALLWRPLAAGPQASVTGVKRAPRCGHPSQTPTRRLLRRRGVVHYACCARVLETLRLRQRLLRPRMTRAAPCQEEGSRRGQEEGRAAPAGGDALRSTLEASRPQAAVQQRRRCSNGGGAGRVQAAGLVQAALGRGGVDRTALACWRCVGPDGS